MLRKIFYCNKWGGAFLLLFSILFTSLSLVPLNVSAQFPTGCNDWEIEICSEIKPPSNVDPSCANPFPYNPCNTVYYYVYLSKTGNQNNINTPFQFNFYEFNLNGSVIVTPSLLTSRITSKPNEEVSLTCSPYDLNVPNVPSSPLYSVEETNKKFSFKVVDSGAAVNWTVLGRRLLCVLAVDAYPGEIIELGQLACSVKFSNGNICNLPIGGCDADPIPSYQVFPPSSSCNSTGFQLKQGTAQNAALPGYPNRKKIPVFVFSQPNVTFNVERLDFLMKVEAPALMAGVSVEAGLFSAKELVVYDETTGPFTNKRIFADYRDIVIDATNVATAANTLFYIILDGPALSSDCGTTTVTFSMNRRLLLSPNGSCCQPSIVGNAQVVEWDTPPCPGLCSNLKVTAKTASSIPPNADPCHSLFFDVDLLSLSSKIYTEGKVVVEIKHSGTLTWSSALSYSYYCSVLSACVSVVQIAPGLLRLTFQIDENTPIDLSSSQPTNLIRFGFTATDACIEGITFRDAIFTEENVSIPCLPTFVSEVNGAVIADDICITSLTMTYELHSTGTLMEAVGYRVADDDPTETMDPITCERAGPGNSLTIGSVPICACYLPNLPQWVYPSKEDNPLNGVTTYDLVLISKHILGIEPFDNGYKLTAADVNGSTSITTFDIVELRKLILGIYGPQPPSDPPNPWPYHSYRFVDKAVQQPPFPLPLSKQTVQITIPPLGAVAAFRGIKIGDVNNTAARPAQLSIDEQTATTLSLGFAPSFGEIGTMVRIPVFIQDALDCNSWQMGVNYDPLQLKLTDIAWASQMGEMSEQYWSESSPGNIRLLGYNAIGDLVHLPKGTPLFYLEGELLQDASDVTIRLNEKEGDFPSESYGMNGDGRGFALRNAKELEVVMASPANSVPKRGTWSAEIYPNPAGKSFRIQLTAPEDGVGNLRFFNSLGQLVTEQTQNLIKGENIITSANLPMLQSGQYIVEIDAPWGQKSLRLVKH